MNDPTHPNLSVMSRLDLKDIDACADVFADNFVWHYTNAKMPQIEGDYLGVSGLKDFFAKLGESSSGSFEVKPVDIRAVGDELVFTQVCNRLASEATGGEMIEFDAIVIWRIVDGKISEAWDIPAVNTVRKVSARET